MDWLPAISVTGGFAVVLWLARNLITTRLTRSVEFEFNQKLAAISAQLRESEERLRAELRLKEAEIAALRSGTLSALSSRQIALDKRRLEAVDQLWAGVMALDAARGISSMMSNFKLEAVAAEVERGPKMREALQVMGGNFDIKSVDVSAARKAKPFVSPMVWAIFSAIQAVAMNGAIRWHLLKSGIGKDFSNNEAIAKLVKAALPHYSDYLEQHGPSVYNHVLDELDTRLHEELQRMLSGAEADKATLDQAADIVKMAGELMKQSASQQAA